MRVNSSTGRWQGIMSVFLAMLMIIPCPSWAQSENSRNENHRTTVTPIKHVIIIIGENRTFDNIFATYVPKHGTVANLLSKGVIHSDGSPGPNAALATQSAADDQSCQLFHRHADSTNARRERRPCLTDQTRAGWGQVRPLILRRSSAPSEKNMRCSL